jgi:hypothetical protein
MSCVKFSLTEIKAGSGPLLFGVPFDTLDQTILSVNVHEGRLLDTVKAENSGQTALLIEPADGRASVYVEFSDKAGAIPGWLFTPTGGAHEIPSPELTQLVAALNIHAGVQEQVTNIVRHVDERFFYGKRDHGLGDGQEAMPALVCDSHAGTCVDTHSYAVAAIRASGIEAAYISGVFFKQGRTVSAPGHCWFAVNVDGRIQHWDISHHLKYDLGPTMPVYNPLAGTRFALSAGRDLMFTLPRLSMTVSVLKGFIDAGSPQGLALRTMAELC